jgi:RimJ/RimL family protein N-acetyltransferase
MINIKSKRITLKQVVEADLDFVCEIESDKDLWQHEVNITTDHEQIKDKFIERMSNKDVYDFILLLNEEAETRIGLAYIWSYIKERNSWEIGYVVLPEFQNQGYCTEALQALFNFAFTKIKAHKIVAMCNENNLASHKVMENVGMVREGVFRKELFWNDNWVDQYFYCILEDEYSN